MSQAERMSHTVPGLDATAPAEFARPASRSPRPAAAPRSLRDIAYDEIKHRITTCAFAPGDYLNEASVSALLGIGRTPVHQALDRLMLEGMVEVMPRKGVIVKPVSLDEVLQIIEVRLLNETYAARLAAEHADDNDLAMLTDIMNRTEQWAAVRNIEQLMLLDRDFHNCLAQAARNNVLAELLRRLQDRSLRFWFISLKAPGHHATVLAEHAAVLSAVRARDPDGAAGAMRTHIESFRRNVTHHI
jgi:DNA-binding GntR family transcriptional regulator